MHLKKIIDEFIVFAVVFPGLLLILKTFFKDMITLSYYNILLIFILSFINILVRHFLIIFRDKNNMSNRNFEFIRRMIMLIILGAYFFFRQG